MMLVVPLSSCITDNTPSSHSNNALNEIDQPSALTIPGSYIIKYNNLNNSTVVKEYDGTFAYAARLPTNWVAPDGKVFAGWSKTNPNSGDLPSTIGEDVSSSAYDYLVYDDIKYNDKGIPEGATIESGKAVLNLYAVWIDTPADGKLNTVYLSAGAGNDDNDGKIESTAVKTFSRAYALLDPKGTTTTNRIIIIDNYTPDTIKISNDGDMGVRLWDNTNHTPATIRGKDSGSSLNFGGGSNSNSGLILRADTVFEDIKITKSCKQAFFYCCGNNLTMGENIDTSSIKDISDTENNSYAIPSMYPALTILGGGYAKGFENEDHADISSFEEVQDPSKSKDVVIKLLSGVYGRVSGFGRSYEDIINDKVETLCPTIIISDSARVGTLAAGHLDSNATTGVNSTRDFKTAKLIIRTNDEPISYNVNTSRDLKTSIAAINLVGGNIGNTKANTFLGNVEISVYSGNLENIYGAGLGRFRASKNTDFLSATYMSGEIKIYICGGNVAGNVYGGGAAASLSKDAVIGNMSLPSSVYIQIQNGTIHENIFGGGYGKSDFIPNDKLHMLSDVSGQVIGNTEVVVLGGIISGSVYGGGEGIEAYESVAKVVGNTTILITEGSADIETKPLIQGNVYGGGKIGTTYGNTNIIINSGTIGGTEDGGRVFGGGEGNPISDWAGKVSGSTNVTISNGTILGSVYGGGDFGVVGTENVSGSSTTLSISGSDIAGSVYGGGKGDKSNISDGSQSPDPSTETISNEIKKGNVYGNTSVTISGGKIGYLNGSSEQSWYDSEDSGSVYGGGKLGLVVGTTDVTISGNAEIHRNVYGGGKGLSKSVFIETDGTSINASLYNMIQILNDTDKEAVMKTLGSNPSFVSKYIWEGSNNLPTGYTLITNDTTSTGHSISTTDFANYKYVRLTVEVENEVIGTERITSNVIDLKDASYDQNAAKNSWMLENRKLVQFGVVTDSTKVTVSGDAKIHSNVYGGGSYAAVGVITGKNLTDPIYNFEHTISGGSTNVTITGGQIGGISSTSGDTHSQGGNVYGGGMGEPDNVTAGSVGKSASINISNGTINGNVYGGGENGSIGEVTISISSTMNPIQLNNGTKLITYSYGLRISDSIGASDIGATSVTISGGSIGDAVNLGNANHGNIFGAGKGVNATVTGRSSVEISGATVNGNVYGGGDLGAVGQLKGTSGKDISLTGGSAKVTINSGEINGSVFGGGKGQSKSVSAEALILGTVQHTEVTINGGSINRISGDNPRGNVYGGGELGLVGALTELTERDVAGNLKFKFTNGSANVTISGNTIIEGSVYGGGKGEDGTITHPEAPLTTIILGSVASSTEVEISGNVSIGTVVGEILVDGTGSVYGGGELGIVGTYSDTDNTRIYVGGNSTTVISGGTILNEVYGGGKGTVNNVLSGAVGDATTIVSGNTTIKGNVYGGGAYSIVGGTSVTIDRTPKDGKIDPKITAANNDATVNVVILGGTIMPDHWMESTGSNSLTSSIGNVFGGGYGPKATVAGSTYIFIGKQDTNDSKLNNLIQNTNQTAVTIFGNVFGGGDMGSIGFDVNTSQVDTPEFGKDYGTSKPSNISSNVSIKTSGTNITIGGISKNDKVGNIYAGGRGGNLLHIISDKEIKTLKGYAIVHGDSNLIIEGTNNGNITIAGSIYGAGQGVPDVTTPGKIDVILYAAVTGNTSISILKANVNNVYGGGQLSILGWYYDDANPSLHGASDGVANKDYRHYTGSDTKIIINDSMVKGNVYGGGMGTTANAISGAVGESTVIIGRGSIVNGDIYGGGAYAVVSNELVVNRSSVDNNIRPTIADSDNISKAVVVILDAQISGNVFGGGYGPRAVIAGSTHVFIGVSDNTQYLEYPKDLMGDMGDGTYAANITGSVYGGGNMGSVGFIEYLEGTDNEESFPEGYQPISVSSNVILSLNDKDTNSIFVGGDVYGGGRGGDLYILDNGTTTIKKPDNWYEGIDGRTLYGYAVVHGQSKVSITGVYTPAKSSLYIDITGDVFGGGEGIEASEGQNSLDVIVYAAVTDTSSVTISHAHISGDIYGGGNLGVVGYFIDKPIADKIFRNFTGKDSRVTINASLIEGTVFGGGRGTTNNILSGAVGNTNVVIMGEETAPNGKEIAAASTIRGSVFGGGAYALVGSMGITITVNTNGEKENPTVTECNNSSRTNVIILNSIIESNSKKNDYGGSGNVFGGGYGPRAVIAGSTNVYIGSETNTATSSATSSVIIEGSVFGGGNMGSIGVIPGVFSFDKVDDYSKVNSELGKYGGNTIKADVKVVINKESDDIHIKGSVYGGGKGGDLTVGPSGPLNTPLKGYAVVYGTAEVYIHGNSSDSKIIIDRNVYGGGLGETKGVNSIQYAEIYDSATVSVIYTDIGGSVYGGGEFGIIGHFMDGEVSHESAGDKTTWIMERDFCGDAFYYNEGKPTLDEGGNGYKGKATTTVTIEGSSISGSIYGGGKGKGTVGTETSGNILSGAVGRETNVTINNGTVVNGNVYGGGEFGIVGSATTQVIMITDSSSTNPFENPTNTTFAASVIVNIPHIKLTGDEIESNLDIQNEVCTHVNINGGTISGSVFGAGKGENLNPLRVWTAGGINKAEYKFVEHAHAYNKLSVIGRTEVNISNGIINKHVYSGSENGDVGGFSTLKHLMQYLSDMHPNQPIDLSELASLDPKIRDNNTYTAPDGSSKNILNYQFSAAFVNIVGGTIHGNVFGGGYFGAIYGNTHVHIGWNSVMPYDDGSKGDCHYYNNYGDGNYADKGHPFDITEGSGKTKADYVHDLFINGTVFAGGDRGDPSATTVDYDYISVYGSSHIFVNGTGYATGTNTSGETKAMYIQGSLFGSGNSCSTFYVDRDMSRFITITNYNAINDQNQFIIYSIQRVTNVTLINSSIRLPGRSDGSNVNVTALYSLNHVNSLTLRSGSILILDTIVQDLRNIYSKVNKDSDEDAQLNTTNIIRLNNGISLIVAELQIHEASISGSISDNLGSPLAGAVITLVTNGKTYSAIADSQGRYTLSKIPLNTTGKITVASNGIEIYTYDLKGLTGDLTINFPNSSSLLEVTGEKAASSTYIFGEVNGYFKLDIQDPKYYGGYIYGELKAKGGFVYGETFKDVATGTVPYTDYTSINEGGYRVWKAGGTHQSSTTTLIADGNKNEKSTDSDTSGYNMATGSASLPMTTMGTKYKLVGYTIYPSQATSISKPNEHRSLTLLPYYGAVGGADGLPNSVLDANSYFGLHMAVNPNSFNPDPVTGYPPGLWIDPNVFDFNNPIYESPATTIGGTTLPELDFTLYYKDGVNATGSAGTVIVFVQEMIPFTDAGGKDNYLFGDEIQISVSIETQSKVENYGTSYSQDTYLYPSTTGEYSWNFIIPPVGNGNGYYDITLKSIKSNDVTLNDSSSVPSGSNQYQLIMSAVNNQDGSEGWDGFASSGEYLTTNSQNIAIGRSDGRFNASIEFTLKNEKDLKSYTQGTVTAVFDVDYYAKGSDKPIHSTLTLTIHIENRIPIYTVVFDTGDNATVVPYQLVEFNDKPYKPVDPRKIVPLTRASLMNASNPGELVFLGWKNSEGKIVDITQVPVVGNTTYTAVWAYKLTFDHNDGSGSSTEIYYDGSNGSATLIDPSRTGYIFKGWYESKESADAHTADGKSSNYFNNNFSPTSNQIYYAGWEEISYNITFDYNGGDLNSGATAPSDVSVKIGGTVTLPEGTILIPPNYGDPTKSYKFNGWSLNKDAKVGSNGTYILTSEDIAKYAVDNTLTFYAIWSAFDNHNVTISATPNGSADFKYVIHTSETVPDNAEYMKYSASFLVTNGNYVTIMCTPKSGYEFTSWENDSSTELSITVQITNDIEIKANLAGKTYAVNFAGEGVSSGQTIKVQYGQKYSYNPNAPNTPNSFPNDPKKDAYDFAGWYSSNLKEMVNTDSIVRIAEDHILTAQFKAIDYTIIFHSNYAPDAIKQQIFNIDQANSTHLLPQNLFARDGHTFSGWDTKSDGSGTDIPDRANIFEKNPDGTYKYLDLFTTNQLNLYAQWTASTLTIEIGKNLIYNGKDWRNNPEAIVTKVMQGTDEIISDLTYDWFIKIGTEYVMVPDSGVIDAGTYYVQVTHTTDSVKSAITAFNIGKRDLSASSVRVTVDNLTYAGRSQDPNFSVSEKIDNIELIASTDYTHSYASDGKANVTDVGEYTLILKATDMGNYAGTKSVKFNVNPLDIIIVPLEYQWKYYGDDLTYIYTGYDNNTNPNANGIGYQVTADPDSDGVYDVIITPGNGGYSELTGSLGLTDITDIKFADVTDNYTISQGTLVNDATNDKNPNYTISFTDNVVFKIKKLPIIIKPDENQWKYYGDLDNQIHKTNADGKITNLSGIDYKVSAKMNGAEINDKSKWLTLDDWNTTYATPSLTGNYNQLSGISVSYDGADRFKDVGQYDTTVSQSGNTNYDISIFGEDGTNQKVKFTIEKLPIFIVPLKDQWKYYGYDGSVEGMYIGVVGDTKKSNLIKELQYIVYNYSDEDNPVLIENTAFSDTPGSGYAKIKGSLSSEMLKSSALVNTNGYSIEIGTITTDSNPNYVVNYYPSNPNPINSNNATLGAEPTSIPTEPPKVPVIVRPITITIRGSVEYNGTSSFVNPVSLTNEIISDLKLVGGDSITITSLITSSPLAKTYTVGASENNNAECTLSITNASGTDVTGQYKITQTGSIEITKKKLSIDINGSKVYDGTNALTLSNLNISVDGSIDIPTGATGNIIISGLVNGDSITEIKIMTNGNAVGDYSGNVSGNLTIDHVIIMREKDDRSSCYDISIKESSTLKILGSVEYETYGGTNDNRNPVSFDTTTGNPVKLYDPTKANFVFGGWYLNQEFSGDKVEQITKAYFQQGNEITLHAKWQAEVTVTVNLDGNAWDEFLGELYLYKDGKDSIPFEKQPDGTYKVTADLDTYQIYASKDKSSAAVNTNATVNLTGGSQTASIQFWKVTFDANGHSSSTPDKQIILSNNSVLNPGNLTATDDYSFTGWYKLTNGTQSKTEWNFTNDKVTETMTLQAGWEQNKHTVEITVTKDGTAWTDQTIKLVSTTDTNAGFTLTHSGNGVYSSSEVVAGSYYIYKDTENTNIAAISITKDTTNTVSATLAYFTVTFDANGHSSSTPDKQIILSNNSVLNPGNLTATDDYSFTGWYKLTNGTQSKTEWNFTNDKVTETMTLQAGWEQNKHTVEITVTKDGTAWTDQTIKLVSTTDTNAGFTLTHSGNGVYSSSEVVAGSYYIYKDTENTNIAAISITKDTTNTVSATLAYFTVTFDANGGSGIYEDITLSGIPYTLPSLNETGIIAPANKQFKGWSYTAAGEAITTATIEVTQAIDLYALWTPDSPNPDQSYTVEFESNGGSEVSSVDVASGEKVTKPADPTKSGYEFKGWYKDNGTFLQEWNFDKDVVTADITLYAKWEPKDTPTPTIYKVEYNANGGEGEVPKAELHFAGEFVTVKSADLRKNGYTFKGWCDSVTQTTYQPDEKFRMPSRDVCLTAIWESDPISGKEVSVTFIVDNEIYGISSTHINTALNGAMQADPVKEGFDFIGWYTKEGEVFTANTIVNNDMTVYAKFELNEDYVLVTYIIDNEIYMTLACKKTKIIEPNISAGIGKELNGWYTDKELQNKFSFDTIINEDSLTLYAEWKNNSNFMILFIFALFAGFMAAVIASTKRISFYENKNDEEKYASVIIIGKGTLKDRLPSHSNSNFEGWYSESGELITEDTEITQSMKVYAHWKH